MTCDLCHFWTKAFLGWASMCLLYLIFCLPATSHTSRNGFFASLDLSLTKSRVCNCPKRTYVRRNEKLAFVGLSPYVVWRRFLCILSWYPDWYKNECCQKGKPLRGPWSQQPCLLDVGKHGIYLRSGCKIIF